MSGINLIFPENLLNRFELLAPHAMYIESQASCIPPFLEIVTILYVYTLFKVCIHNKVYIYHSEPLQYAAFADTAPVSP